MHTADVHRLIEVLQKLVDGGNSMIVIEHNLGPSSKARIISSTWDPTGGDNGGEIVAMGTPEEVASNKNSYTGMYLKKILQNKD